MTFHIITIFPQIFDSYLKETIIRRAIKRRLVRVNIIDLRRFAKRRDSHKSVDGRPYGGGPGMILMVEPIYKALRALRIANYELRIKNKRKIRNPQSVIYNSRIIMLSPDGKKFTQREAGRLAKYKQIVLLCGRYEGFDARVEKLVDEKISIGDYVLAGGELPAMVVLEVVARHVPGVVGHKDALKEETFSKGPDYVEYPQYTRPEVFYPYSKSKRQSWRVPKALLSGNHEKIKEWREKQAKKRRKY